MFMIKKTVQKSSYNAFNLFTLHLVWKIAGPITIITKGKVDTNVIMASLSNILKKKTVMYENIWII